MSVLVEIDRLSGAFNPVGVAGVELPLLGAGEWHGEAEAGLRLAGDTEPEQRFATARLIAIEFPAFHDGRGLSLAVLLRTRFGFQGELRAIGDIRPDLLHYLQRCGFDTFLLAEGASFDRDDPRLAPHTRYYQASVVEPEPVFRREERAA